jgi:inner membrane protein
LWRNLPVGHIFGRVFDKMLGGHRFLTHTILGLVLFGLAAHWLLIFLQPIMKNVNIGYVWWAFMIGMLSHLIMDSLTKEGVPWLLPIPIKFGFPPLKKFRVRTGHWAETLIIFPGLLVLNALLYWTNYSKLLELVRFHLV